MQNRNRFYLKACLKCGGDMYLDWDSYGCFRKCLQCSRIVDLEKRPESPAETWEKKLAA